MKIYKKYDITQCALYKCSSKKRLEHLLNIEAGEMKNIESVIKYSQFSIDKKNSDEKRKITAPQYTIKRVQKRILVLLQNIERPQWLISGEKGKSYINNGMAHVGNCYAVTIDIKKFYDNCVREPVYLFFINKMKTQPDIAKILTDIVTYDGGIPTGCPTSQLVAYYAYEDMFDEISNIADSYNCVFTLYVDDMTFSSDKPINYKRLVQDIDVVLRKYGHKPKYSKVKYYPKNKDTPITGTILNKNGELVTPNALQKSVYDKFQKIKELDPNLVIENPDDKKTLLSLQGQIQATRRLEENKFPEISRIVKNYSVEVDKPKTNNKKYPKGKIHIPN